MTNELKETLESSGLPVEYRHMENAVVPYITYYIEDTDIEASDMGGRPAVYTDSCVVELHTAQKEADMEKALEAILPAGDITKHEEYDYSESLFEITYRFKLKYKVK